VKYETNPIWRNRLDPPGWQVLVPARPSMRNKPNLGGLVQNRPTVLAGGSVKAGRAAPARIREDQRGRATRF
jgi:hypothetical protein